MAGPTYQQDPNEMRYWREQASPFRFIYDAARARDAELSASGRKPTLGGLMSKEAGDYGLSTNEWEVDNNLGGVLAGLLAPVLKAFDAPSSAYQGFIPEQDLIPEVMATAGLAMGGGAASSLRKVGELDPEAPTSNFGEDWSDVNHWSQSNDYFDDFDFNKMKTGTSNLGPHVGTAAAAEARKLGVEGQTGGLTYPLKGDLRKPFNNPKTGRIWEEADLEEFLSNVADENNLDRSLEAPQFMRQRLAAEGYTNIPYKNGVEDIDSTSNIMLIDRPNKSDAVLRNDDARFDNSNRSLRNLSFANKSGTAGLLSTAAADELRSSNVPRQMPSNNVLDPVDRLTPEQLAGAVPFERVSGFAEPRVGGGRAKDPALFTPFSSKKQSGVAPSDWSVSGRRLSSETEAPQLKSAEGLQDAGFTDMFGFVADSTMGDTIFDRINDVELPRSVMQQGGHEFGDNIDGRGFASDDVALGTKEKVWRKTVEEGGRPVVTPMTMGTAGGDFSMHETMNLAQLIAAMADNIDPNFVPLRGAAKNNERFLPEGMGLLSSELPAYLSNLKGGDRAAFVKSLDTAPALNAGVPSVGAVRWASTAPELAGQPLLSSGFRAFEPETGGFFNYGDTHASYNATIPRVGENMTMGETRPWYLQFPDEAYPKMVASTPKGSNMLKTEALPKDIRGFQMNPNMSQKIDNQWVDAQMTYDEILKNQGKEAADMYALDALVNRAQMSGNY